MMKFRTNLQEFLPGILLEEGLVANRLQDVVQHQVRCRDQLTLSI